MSLFKKGVAVPNFQFRLLDETGAAVTTGTTTAVMTVDGSQGATLANATHVGNGVWVISLTADEMNGDSLYFLPLNASAVTPGWPIYTYTVIDGNLLQINGATLPVNNLENTFNGVGYIAPTAPAQQQQVENLSSGTGGNKNVASTVTVTTGTSSDPIENSFYSDGLIYEVLPSAGNTDFEFEFDLGQNSTGTGLFINVYVQGNNDTCTVSVYNYISATWNEVQIIAGTTGQTLQPFTPDVLNGQTGIGVDSGKVRVRFESANANAIGIEQVFCEYNVVADSGFIIREGYAQGGTTQKVILDAGASSVDDFYIHDAVIFPEGTGAGEGGICVGYNGTNKELTFKEPLAIAPDSTTKFRILFGQTHSATTSGGYDSAKVYINGATGEAGTTKEVNGIISNPVDNMPDARTIADLVNIKTLSFSGGAALALDQSYIDFKFEFTQGQLFDLNGQDVGGSAFLKSGITGNMIASKRVNFELCGLFDCSLGLSSLLQSGIAGTITLANNDRYQFDQCFANDPNITPTININGNGVVQTLLYLNDYKGTATISNLTSSDYIEANGNMRLILDSTCSGGTISKNGNVFIEDNSTISPTFICGLACDTNEAIKLLPTAAQIDAELTANHGAGSWLTGGGGTATDVNIISVNGTPTTSINDFKADVSGLATAASLQTVDTNVDAVLADTNELQLNQSNWLTADVSGLSTTAQINARTLDTASYATITNQTTINNNVLTRLADADYVAPDNVTIASIDGKVDTITLSVADIPNNAEFNARTLLSAEYSQFDSNSDSVTINSNSVDAIWTTALTESYAANGAEFTAAQALYMSWSDLRSPEQIGTTWTDYKIDNSTTAMTFTLNDALEPSKKTRAS